METKIQEKLRFVDILRQAATLLGGNISLLVLAFFFSLLLFCVLVFFELSLQNTLYLASEYLLRQGSTWRHYYPEYPREPMPVTGEAVAWQVMQTCLLYFLPYHFLDLLTTTVVVAASSTVYASEQRMGLGLLVQRTVEICRKRLGVCLITSLYVLMFSTSAFFGFIFAATNYYSCAFLFGGGYRQYVYIDVGGNNYRYYYNYSDPPAILCHVAVILLHVAVFAVLTAKFNKWSSTWNTGLVVSVLEDRDEEAVYGTDALSLSACYSRGHEGQGLWLMLVFFVNALVLRLPCVYSKCSESRIGVLYTCAYAGLICVGNVFKWVACVVFYHESRTRFLEKKADLEVGERAKPSATQKVGDF